MRSPIRRWSALMFSAVAVAAGACGSGQDSTAVPTGPSTSVPATTLQPGSTTTPGGADPLAGASTSPVSVPPSRLALLTAVRGGAQDGFERVVFEFESGVPGYRVEYVERPIVEDASGNEVEVEGAAVLLVHMEAASGVDLSGSSLRQTYTGPGRIDPGTTAVNEVVRIGDFEANLSWVIGLSAKVRFKVSTLTDPARLVVDLAPS